MRLVDGKQSYDGDPLRRHLQASPLQVFEHSSRVGIPFELRAPCPRFFFSERGTSEEVTLRFHEGEHSKKNYKLQAPEVACLLSRLSSAIVVRSSTGLLVGRIATCRDARRLDTRWNVWGRRRRLKDGAAHVRVRDSGGAEESGRP